MTDYVTTPQSTSNPSWRQRNRAIAKIFKISKKDSILDLGCGSKDLLNYCKPKKYIGIDYNDIADIKINFNNEFTIPKYNWDFIVCSGLIEYLNNASYFLDQIKNNSETYVITYKFKLTHIENENKLTHAQFKEVLIKHFEITKTIDLKTNSIFICKDLK